MNKSLTARQIQLLVAASAAFAPTQSPQDQESLVAAVRKLEYALKGREMHKLNREDRKRSARSERRLAEGIK